MQFLNFNDLSFTQADRSKFDRRNYACVSLLRKTDGTPVFLYRNADLVNKFPSWLLTFEFSSIVFSSREAALAYCQDRGFVPLEETAPAGADGERKPL